MSAVDEEIEKLKRRIDEAVRGATGLGNTILYPSPPSQQGPQSFETMRIIALEQEVQRLRFQLGRAQMEHQELLGQVAEARRRYQDLLGRQMPSRSPDWIKKHLRFLIFACHPDRNDGKEEAQAVTKELLKLR